MLFKGLITLAMASLAVAITQKAPAADDKPAPDGVIPGYEIVPVTWEVRAFDDGPLLSINGTVEQVMDELRKINPNIDAEVHAAAAAAKLENRDSPSLDTSLLSKRYDREGHFCGGRWPVAAIGSIWSGIEYLRGVKGQPGQSGSGKCGRVSCSDNGAIYWCNDNTGYKTLNSWSDIANAADYIARNCVFDNPGYFLWGTSGQIFYKDKWNVIVRNDNC
ncbi:hypothetical protein QBC35DRAFT_471016 [Podospora australis]|uniref:Secreted protein n=1 Tax=Podospora australis TaxID=1536484 RepID=A0AAN6X4L3_9PEZI|nr:hypothetical protein QBC35DRAFT_471016 [Podospora australis]